LESTDKESTVLWVILQPYDLQTLSVDNGHSLVLCSLSYPLIVVQQFEIKNNPTGSPLATSKKFILRARDTPTPPDPRPPNPDPPKPEPISKYGIGTALYKSLVDVQHTQRSKNLQQIRLAWVTGLSDLRLHRTIDQAFTSVRSQQSPIVSLPEYKPYEASVEKAFKDAQQAKKLRTLSDYVEAFQEVITYLDLIK
jgi:hypothetical protein